MDGRQARARSRPFEISLFLSLRPFQCSSLPRPTDTFTRYTGLASPSLVRLAILYLPWNSSRSLETAKNQRSRRLQRRARARRHERIKNLSIIEWKLIVSLDMYHRGKSVEMSLSRSLSTAAKAGYGGSGFRQFLKITRRVEGSSVSLVL